jgi:spore coat protein U-like protein
LRGYQICVCRLVVVDVVKQTIEHDIELHNVSCNSRANVALGFKQVSRFIAVVDNVNTMHRLNVRCNSGANVNTTLNSSTQSRTFVVRQQRTTKHRLKLVVTLRERIAIRQILERTRGRHASAYMNTPTDDSRNPRLTERAHALSGESTGANDAHAT